MVEIVRSSDIGILLFGLIIEAVTGQSYNDTVRERFIEPLGLGSTGPSNQRNLPHLARGYVSTGSGLSLPEFTTDDDAVMVWDPAIEWTGGGLYSTSRDLAVWGRAFLSGELVSPPVFADAVKGVSASENDPLSLYGLGIAIRADSEHGPVYGHRGWIPGYVSSLQYYPQHDVSIAFQINTEIGIVGTGRPVMWEIEERLADLILPNQAPSGARKDTP